jgi:hypothetical protein
MRYLIILALLFTPLGCLGGCVTVKAPDGTSTTSFDIAAAATAVSLAMTVVEQYQSMRGQIAEAEWQARMAEKQARLEALQSILDQLLAARAQKAVGP